MALPARQRPPRSKPLTPTVFDIGLGTPHGTRWVVGAAAAVATSTAAGVVLGVPGSGRTIVLLTWFATTLGWLGVAFLVAFARRTPGCEMRSRPHLVSILPHGNTTFALCSGPLQPLDEREARATGRAVPIGGDV